jgi:hypothetical protein
MSDCFYWQEKWGAGILTGAIRAHRRGAAAKPMKSQGKGTSRLNAEDAICAPRRGAAAKPMKSQGKGTSRLNAEDAIRAPRRGAAAKPRA